MVSAPFAAAQIVQHPGIETSAEGYWVLLGATSPRVQTFAYTDGEVGEDALGRLTLEVRLYFARDLERPDMTIAWVKTNFQVACDRRQSRVVDVRAHHYDGRLSVMFGATPFLEGEPGSLNEIVRDFACATPDERAATYERLAPSVDPGTAFE